MCSRYRLKMLNQCSQSFQRVCSVSSSVMCFSLGYKLIKKCSSGVQSECVKCSDGTYQDSMNYFPNCFRCQKCTKRKCNTVLFPFMTSVINLKWCSNYISLYLAVLIASLTGHAVVISPCTHQNNTVCGCQPGFRKRSLDGDSLFSISWDCVPFKRTQMQKMYYADLPQPLSGINNQITSDKSALKVKCFFIK